jgi:hypothetical protein
VFHFLTPFIEYIKDAHNESKPVSWIRWAGSAVLIVVLVSSAVIAFRAYQETHDLPANIKDLWETLAGIFGIGKVGQKGIEAYSQYKQGSKTAVDLDDDKDQKV